MTLTERAVLDLAETWYHQWHTEDGGASFLDLYQAISAWKNEPCAPPSTMWADLQVQMACEAGNRAMFDEHLIEISIDTGRVDDLGERIFEEALYLDSNRP